MPAIQSFLSFQEKYFRLAQHGTTAKTEVLAGTTTFMTMAYILAVNPAILSVTGMDAGGVFTATALSACVATLAMALLAKLPFALAPGMGLNAFFAYTVVLTMGYTWQFALTAVFLEGLIFLVLTASNLREALLNAIPLPVQQAMAAGVGLFIAFIGLQSAGIIVDHQATLVTLGPLASPAPFVCLTGLVVTGILLAKKVKAALLLGIALSTITGIFCGVTDLSILKTHQFFTVPSLSPVLFQIELSAIFSMDMLLVLFTFLFVDIFDTMGALTGMATRSTLLDDKGRLPGAKQAFFADAIGTTFGALTGTSTVTTYIESSAGVAAGGRTGLTALTTALLFAAALFLAPFFLLVPKAATAPVLILVGLFMLRPINRIDLTDYTNALPAFLTILIMPLTYSIAEGIVFGILSYVPLKLCTGKHTEIAPLTWLLFVLFILRACL